MGPSFGYLLGAEVWNGQGWTEGGCLFCADTDSSNWWRSGRSENMFGPNSNWFAFQDDFTRSTEESTPTFLITSSPRNEGGPSGNVVSPPNSSGESSSDDEVVLGEDEDLVDTASSARDSARMSGKVGDRLVNGAEHEGLGSPTFRSMEDTELGSKLEKVDLSDNLSLFQQRQQEPGAGAVNFFVKLVLWGIVWWHVCWCFVRSVCKPLVDGCGE